LGKGDGNTVAFVACAGNYWVFIAVIAAVVTAAVVTATLLTATLLTATLLTATVIALLLRFFLIAILRRGGVIVVLLLFARQMLHLRCNRGLRIGWLAIATAATAGGQCGKDGTR